MPLETATYVSQLASANPAHSDQLNQADAHLRLIKSVLLATFPNFTAAALNSTQAAIDAAAAQFPNGAAVLADAGAFFKTNTGDGFTNPVAGEVDLKSGAATTKFKSDGSVTATSFVGIGTMPIGGSMPWYEDTLPDASYGDYAWLNGQVIASANTRCPVLLARWTSRFGGNGVSTMGVPDMREVAPYGKSTMGSTSSPGRITNYVLTTLGGIIGACLHGLTGAENGVHDHGGLTGNPTTHPIINASLTNQQVQPFGVGFGGPNSSPTPTLPDHLHTIPSDGSGTPHDNVSPGIVCNWVVRLA